MHISLIVAMDIDNTIGTNGKIPWYLPADFKHFKKVTMSHPIIMGRKTHESIGKILPNRLNIVISRQKNYKVQQGAYLTHSLEEAIHIAKKQNTTEIFIIGGGELYRQALSNANRLYITQILHSFTGDTYFPEIDWNKWTLTKEEKKEPDKKNNFPFIFLQYDKK